jgi:hypothetical protein
MTAAQQQGSTAPTECWCCGKAFGEDKLVRLGQHPEVGLCRQCATWVKRHAVARRHAQQPYLASQLLRGIDAVRNKVIDRGWHDHHWLGPLLRRIDRHLL